MGSFIWLTLNQAKNNPLANWVQSRRRAMNLTQVELAEKVGCAASHDQEDRAG